MKRDPAKRRYRHHWERAIRALVRAARGRDAPVALLEAARARYGLYRFSAVEADREAALALAARAARRGSREAAAFARAVHREAGDDETVPAKGPKVLAKRRAERAAPAAKPAPAPKPDDDEESTDPILDETTSEQPAAEANKKGSDAEVAEAGQAAEPDGPARVSEVKTWSNSDYTRVAVYLSKATGWQKEEIASDGSLPRRLALDLKPALLLGKAVARPVGDAQVQRVRTAQFDPETVRVVLDLAGSDAYQLFSLDDPPRLIVDVGTREAQRAAQASAAAPAPEQPPEAAPAAETDERAEPATPQPIRRIVIDAGHGGHDAGAIGPTRVREKEVVLAMAKKLAQRLQRAGFQVVLTRRDDTFLPLEERTAIANTAHGDLFVSLHANAHPRRDRRGIETYFLNVADGRYAARLAARENGLLSPEGGEGPQVQRILSDLDANSSTAASSRLAHLVQRELCAGVRAHVGDVRDLGVKSALFYVLLGARMPAVLVETAFVSNRGEERRLASARYQDEVAGSVARAIVAFARREPRVAAVP